jgi:hypothetical protein
MFRGTAGTLKYLGLAGGGLLLYWFARPNTALINPGLKMETWDAIADGTHNSNTDLIHWNGSFYLVHQSSPYHFGTERSRLLMWTSPDARHWAKLAEFRAPRGELRDPKFAAIGTKLFLYALGNVRWDAEPYTTFYTFSEDGSYWYPLAQAEPHGWLFWRPKTFDSSVWFMPAYWHEHGKSILLRSDDGIGWSIVSTIYEGERNDETAIEFLPDGRIVATARLEGSGSTFGDARASTLVAVASAPYVNWSCAKSRVTRLDGPRLFSYDGTIFAIGRYQPGRIPLVSEQGSILSRKRTSLFVVREDGLGYLSDLPSAGDTSYAGAAIVEDELYACYYTSPVDRDYPWILGMVTASNIRMAKISLPSLATLARSRLSGTP